MLMIIGGKLTGLVMEIIVVVDQDIVTELLVVEHTMVMQLQVHANLMVNTFPMVLVIIVVITLQLDGPPNQVSFIVVYMVMHSLSLSIPRLEPTDMLVMLWNIMVVVILDIIVKVILQVMKLVD